MKGILIVLLVQISLLAQAEEPNPCIAWVYPGHVITSFTLTGDDSILVACTSSSNPTGEDINNYTVTSDPLNMVAGEYIKISPGDGTVEFKCW